MKIIFTLAILFIVAAARLNLPDNKVGSDILNSEQYGTLDEIKTKIFFSDTVADWKYTDFVFVKFACSERLKIQLIGVPFQKWALQKKNIDKCTYSLD